MAAIGWSNGRCSVVETPLTTVKISGTQSA
jgi:hypothetical protein